jgi:long-chain acyl-CoA synthetase
MPIPHPPTPPPAPPKKPKNTHTQPHHNSRSAATFAHKRCLGHRPIDGKTGKAGAYQFLTYGEVAGRVDAAGGAYARLGLRARDRVAVLGANCPEWMMAMQGCNRQNLVCVPLYETLGETAIEFILEHSAARVVVVQGSKLARMAAALRALPPASARRPDDGGDDGGGGSNSLLAVVYWGDDTPADAVDAARAALDAHASGGRPGPSSSSSSPPPQLLSWAELLALGARHPAAPDPPQPSDVSTIMYTSGTTGDPKGVLLTHRAVAATIAQCGANLDMHGESVGEDDCYLSFLPLAHIFDRVTEEFMLSRGGAVGYWQGVQDKVAEDIAALRPSLFCGVPRVYDRIHAGVLQQASRTPVRRAIFDWAVERKAYFMRDEGFRYDAAAPFLDWLVFRKVKARLGGRLRLVISGAAPLARGVEEFMNVGLGAVVLQGYGLTETCAAATIADPYNWDQIGTVGPPMPGVQVKLESVPEMGYDATADPPRGEVLLRGPLLFSGYYRQPELTAEAVDADGWFHSGDIGEWVGRGALKIIDRKKNIFKLAQGERERFFLRGGDGVRCLSTAPAFFFSSRGPVPAQPPHPHPPFPPNKQPQPPSPPPPPPPPTHPGEYVAVEKLEAVYKGAPVVEQVWVYGNSFESTLVAVVVPRERELRQLVAGAAAPKLPFADVCALPEARAAVARCLADVGRAQKLRGFEIVKAVALSPHEFSVEAGLITPTYKFKRAALLEAFKGEIERMYALVRKESGPLKGLV